MVLHPLNEPATFIAEAFGAQVLNVTPVPPDPAYGVAPHPGREDWADTFSATTAILMNTVTYKDGFMERTQRTQGRE